MKLEIEIGQNSFRNEYHKLLVNILYTGNWIQERLATHFKPYGITPQQYNILRILRGQHPKPARVQLLQELMLDNMSNASRLVERLRVKGLVKRTICQKDRRAVDVEITEAGLNLLKRLDAAEKEWLSWFETIGLEKANDANTILDTLRD